jgi:branched-chain amino acid transport system permease protein
MQLLSLLLQVLALGAAYSLLALGFVLVLNATGAVNFSQGDLVMAGGFVAVVLGNALHVPGLVLLPILLVLMAALGALIALVAYMPLRGRPAEAVFISTIAVGIILQNGANHLFGAAPVAAPTIMGAGHMRLAGVEISVQTLAIILVATLLILGLQTVFKYTQLGRRLRATAQDREMALALGIPVNAMIVGTFATGAALAGAAGMLLGNVFFVTPTSGSDYILKAYVAVVIGGWGSLPGAVAGGLLIAGFEVAYPSLPLILPPLAAWPDWVFSQTVSTIMLDIVALFILFLRPQGIFGEAISQRP